MEYIDIIDKETGNVIGVSKPKQEVHKNGDWHRTVHIWCVNLKGEILLQRRAKNKENFPDMWDISVAGHVSSGEELVDAALREVKEEIGLSITLKDLEFIGQLTQEFILNEGTYFDNEFQYIYIIKININLNELNMQKEEVQSLQWISINDFKQWVIEKRSDLVPHFEEYNLLLKKLI